MNSRGKMNVSNLIPLWIASKSASGIIPSHHTGFDGARSQI
jgi:hypothetical protein